MMSSFSRNVIKFRNVSILLFIIFLLLRFIKINWNDMNLPVFLLMMTPHNGKFRKAGFNE